MVTLARIVWLKFSGERLDWKRLRTEWNVRTHESHVALQRNLLATGEESGSKPAEKIGTKAF